MSGEDSFKKLISHCKEYGFIYPSSEIYDGLSAVYDYGPNGIELKNNIKTYWWKSMVQMHENIVGLDSAIFMHPKTWKASGHVDAFNDPLVDNKDSKKRFRADTLIEDAIAKIEAKAEKEVEKAKARFGESFDEKLYRETNPRVVEYLQKSQSYTNRLTEAMTKNDMIELKNIIDDLEIVDPDSGSKNWTEVRQFNLMFYTQLGNIAGEEGKLYLRPETAQGIFVNFLNVQKTTRQKIPFGIAQIGKAFRNEIVARQFIFRMREFEQMEMQFFVKPGEEMQWYEYWKETRLKWHKSLGTPSDKLKFHNHENLAHYANAAVDIQYDFPFGFKELEGIHSRTNFDLTSHQELSGKKLQYFDPEMNENYVPFVVETSIGCDRMFLALMSQAFTEENVPDADGQESQRIVLKLHPAIAPIKCAVLPLVKNKPELVEQAKQIFNDLKFNFQCQYDDKDAIGRRYRRQDAIGTPFCVTVDFETMSDHSVTIRERDSLLQERVLIKDLANLISNKIAWQNLFK
ncbi:MAG: glycine--tRNA ligase [Saprospiraceae bacterium]|uniref:Glycine--tRNA ligase n=1 Tax=Candidatus Defluviibacterium haderslevense TaxID=2981993 RepID=A0A9D7S5D4_9BACT|nr:glycine--tRNA ligase [Candidatus Defluviibacterium haderslevense]MBL0238485.1 glycine--tRNA ligase [Candidatus Defluviibacterium haderslevense]